MPPGDALPLIGVRHSDFVDEEFRGGIVRVKVVGEELQSRWT